MLAFYLLIWLRWVVRVVLSSIFFAASLSFLVTVVLYVRQGSNELNSEVLVALQDIFLFWFPLFWAATLFLAMFLALKHLFNNCIAGYEFKLLECNTKDVIEVIGYGDLVKVWRKILMLIVWFSAIEMIVVYGLMRIFTDYDSLFEWFNIYVLFGLILVSSYFAFILMGARCKKVKVVKC